MTGNCKIKKMKPCYGLYNWKLFTQNLPCGNGRPKVLKKFDFFMLISPGTDVWGDDGVATTMASLSVS